MKKILSLLTILAVFISCKEEGIIKPERLIEKEMMEEVIYDLTILDAIKYQNPASLETNNINPSKYIYKKYKIDSLQFAQNNVYYASNYGEYKIMFEKITKRIENEKAVTDSLVKIEEKKNAVLLKKKNADLKLKDSLTLKKLIPEKIKQRRERLKKE
ncbi:DUF4296 domain-containing protein [Flavobacterium sp. K5-23]|uniref:DUF4296 domain-containing protein n=1 Tax=Flavobacterium sp. K5-23 TaxID=2746225 RepID=UPI00200D2485|nr:DUF4296 domain-containing protein [Flavobacterium sp. K5-23]UQD55335.1 DUF4296 domain-containing protein [Flavobacterium sp. K5-23]